MEDCNLKKSNMMFTTISCWILYYNINRTGKKRLIINDEKSIQNITIYNCVCFIK